MFIILINFVKFYKCKKETTVGVAFNLCLKLVYLSFFKIVNLIFSITNWRKICRHVVEQPRFLQYTIVLDVILSIDKGHTKQKIGTYI